MKDPNDVLKHWSLSGPIEPADNGLINQTFIIGAPPQGVLQWVNPIFDTAIQLDIQALTERLHEAGMTTPRLMPTHDGKLWTEDPEGGFWRMQSFIPGLTVHRLASERQAKAAGEL